MDINQNYMVSRHSVIYLTYYSLWMDHKVHKLLCFKYLNYFTNIALLNQQPIFDSISKSIVI